MRYCKALSALHCSKRIAAIGFAPVPSSHAQHYVQGNHEGKIVMAAHTQSETLSANVASAASEMTHAANSFFDRVARIVPNASAAVACGHEVIRLQKLSDARLAELGIARDDIVAHAYRDL